MKIIIESFILSAFLFLYCYFGKRKSPVNLVYLYEKEVQNKVVELGLINAEKIKKNALFFKVGILGVFFPYLLICVYGINGARGFLEGFLQMIGILAIEGLFDRIVVDIFWVGCTKAWIIPGTEAFMPYIPVKVHIKTWLVTLVMYPAAYVFEGIRKKAYSKTASWTWQGKPLIYLNFEGIEANMVKNFFKNKEMGFRNEYLKALELNKSEENVIKVEIF